MRTALACPDPEPRPVVARFSANSSRSVTVADVSTWPQSPATRAGGARWTLLDLNTPEDRRAP